MVTNEQLQEQIEQLTLLTTTLNELSADIFQRRRELEQHQDKYDRIKTDVRAKVLEMSKDEALKKDLSNAEKRELKFQELIESDQHTRLLMYQINEMEQKIKILQQQFDSIERKYRTSNMVAKLLIAMKGV